MAPRPVGRRPAVALVGGVSCLLLLGAGWPAEAGAPKYQGSEAARAAQAKGRTLIRTLDADIDGDGRSETVLVERLEGRRLVVRVVRWDGPEDDDGRFVTVVEGTPAKASKIERLEARPMVGRRAPEIVAVFDDPSPDETARSVRVMGAIEAGIRELFAETFLVPPPRAAAAHTVSMGDARPHVVFANVVGNEQEEVVWISGPQILQLPGRKGPVTLEIGAYRTVYQFKPAQGRFEKVAEREVVEFSSAKTVSEAKATAQVPKIWGTAQAFWGADGDLETSWNVTSAEAVGQALTVRLKSSPRIRLIRVVPGCGTSEAEWQRHDRLERFRLVLGSGRRFEIDREELERLPDPVLAVGEFPLEEGFGAQILIALTEDAPLPWVRLEILETERSRAAPKARANEACLSEISFH